MIQNQERYVWDYCDPSLRLSSRMALSCLSNDASYAVAQKYGKSEHDYDETLLMNFIQYELVICFQDGIDSQYYQRKPR